MKTTDITTKTQAAAGYTVIRRCERGPLRDYRRHTRPDRVDLRGASRGPLGRHRDPQSDIALAILTFEGRVCQDGTADAIEGGCVTASEDVTDAAVLCTYRPVTRRLRVRIRL